MADFQRHYGTFGFGQVKPNEWGEPGGEVLRGKQADYPSVFARKSYRTRPRSPIDTSPTLAT